MSNSPFKMPKPWLSDLVANPKKKKRLATKYGPKSTVGKRILGGVKWAGKRAFGGPATWGLTIAELGYDFYKTSMQRKKEGKSGFNPTKGQKTSTPKNQGFNF